MAVEKKPKRQLTVAVRKKTKKRRVINLPGEIISKIFSKLPVCTILRCLRPLPLSKELHDIIFNSLFAQSYESHKNTIPSSCRPFSFLVYNPSCVNYSSGNSSFLMEYHHDNGNNKIVATEVNFLSGRKINPEVSKVAFVNSCNGWLLVCLTIQNTFCSLRLVNPVTCCCVTLPGLFQAMSQQRQYRINDRYYWCGLGYSTSTCQYKVVRILQSVDEHVKNRAIIVDVLTLGGTGETGNMNFMEFPSNKGTNDTNMWKRITVDDDDVHREIMKVLLPSPSPSPCSSNPLLLNGALHWLVEGCVILQYDTDKDKLRVIHRPCTSNICSLGMMGGSLCIGTYSYVSHNLDIWVMKDYGVKESWTRLTAAYPTFNSWWPEDIQLIQVLDNGNLLILYKAGVYKLRVYDKKAKKWSRMGSNIGGRDQNMGKKNVVQFLPSFYSLNDTPVCSSSHKDSSME